MSSISQETLVRIEKQLTRLEHDDSERRGSRREKWLLAGFKPSNVDDTWRHEDGRVVTYQQVLATEPV